MIFTVSLRDYNIRFFSFRTYGGHNHWESQAGKLFLSLFSPNARSLPSIVYLDCVFRFVLGESILSEGRGAEKGDSVPLSYLSREA